ncbi:MAG: indole-3-glycerol phosphate synthase TrpC [Aquificae bacterium]|nr:indole-3-glycerol phosphate synthase TrpC [Aquificota bacterium]
MTVLRRIVEAKLPSLRGKKQNPDYRRRVYELAENRREVKNLLDFCCPKSVAVIAEVKRASPSEGLIREVDPVEVAKLYQKGGACAVSVLTEENFFKGSLDFLSRIREAVDLPLLRKDFIVDELEVWEAKAFGADAVLLIAKVLDEVLLRDLIETALGLGLLPLVEVFEENELERVLKYYSTAVGVNNRNLETLEVDLSVSERLLPLMKEAGVKCAVAESGIFTAGDVRRLKRAGADAFLVGTALMKSPDPLKKLSELLSA